MKKQLYIFLILLVSALFISCSPDANNPPDGNDNQPETVDFVIGNDIAIETKTAKLIQ